MSHTIHFNTGAKYSVHGQRIAVTFADDGRVTFYDHDRLIWGELDSLRNRAGVDTPADRGWFMDEYLNCRYAVTQQAMDDAGIYGPNSRWEGR